MTTGVQCLAKMRSAAAGNDRFSIGAIHAMISLINTEIARADEARFRKGVS
jgi:uncharacterized small protein (DUF1192 family)